MTPQGVCPKCKSENLAWDSVEVDEAVLYPYTCEDCDFEGYEIYELTFLGHTARDQQASFI